LATHNEHAKYSSRGLNVKKIVLLAFVLVLLSTAVVVGFVRPAIAEGTIYIRADGRVEPDTAPISSVDNITYNFTDNIYDEIVVERANIVIDGAGYTLQGTGGGTGITLLGRSNVTIMNMEIKAFYFGIYFRDSSNNSIYGNNIKNNDYGIELIMRDGLSKYNDISGNNITDNGCGIGVEYSHSNNISGNNITDNGCGIGVEYSHSNNISGNNITDNGCGIGLSYSDGTIFRNNIKNNDYGIELHESIRTNISGNNITGNNEYGIRAVKRSNYNTISENNIMNNNGSGILLGSDDGGSSHNTISGNVIMNNNGSGIWLDYVSKYNNISGNIINNNSDGILLKDSSDYNTISGNVITNNNNNGIWLEHSSENTLKNNIIVNNKYNFGVSHSSLLGFVNDIDASNTVDGKPICYWISKRDMAVPLEAGYVALVNCTSITVQNLSLTSNWQGALLAYTTNSTITKNNITNNYFGIWLHDSSNNIIYHNNFVDNTEQVYSYDSTNVWDDGYPSGGNYWSDYTGADKKSGPKQDQPRSDGIGDTPYIIDNYNRDNYPLMRPTWSPEIPEEEAPLWMQWWFWTILAAGILALAGVVYFLKKRKPPTPA